MPPADSRRAPASTWGIRGRYYVAWRIKTDISRRRRTDPVSSGEIRVPKEAREFVPQWAEPTLLGDPRGAARQYRYGNLHIREYADHYTVHTDKADPRRDPVGHLIRDAPEILAGAAAGMAAGALSYLRARASGRGRSSSAAAAAAAALSAGSLAYEGAKRLKER